MSLWLSLTCLQASHLCAQLLWSQWRGCLLYVSRWGRWPSKKSMQLEVLPYPGCGPSPGTCPPCLAGAGMSWKASGRPVHQTGTIETLKLSPTSWLTLQCVSHFPLLSSWHLTQNWCGHYIRWAFRHLASSQAVESKYMYSSTIFRYFTWVFPLLKSEILYFLIRFIWNL